MTHIIAYRGFGRDEAFCKANTVDNFGEDFACIAPDLINLSTVCPRCFDIIGQMSQRELTPIMGEIMAASVVNAIHKEDQS